MGLPGVHAIEAAGLRAWPAVETMTDGSWILRAAGGHTNRANSTWCLNPADDDPKGITLTPMGVEIGAIVVGHSQLESD